jgi:hypothetical protein
MAFRNYRLSELATQQAGELGVTRTTVKQMSRHSAPYTDPKWNRRFEQYVFRIEGELVLELGRSVMAGEQVECAICRGRLRMTFYEKHTKCRGRGCSRCDQGQVRVERACMAKQPDTCSKRLGLTDQQP